MTMTTRPERIAPRTAAASAILASSTGKRTRRFSPFFWVAAGWVVLVVLLAIFADLLPIPAYDETVGPPRQAPQLAWETLLGTDAVGRSVLSRLIIGARVSLVVGLLAVSIAVVVGALLGLAAAYFRGWVEAVIAIITDAMLAFPALILLMAIAAALTPSLATLTISLGLLGIPGFIRLTKANALQALGQEYVTAARAMGARTARIMFREVLPNAVIPLLSFALLVIALLMVAEGSLSFLGLGVPVPFPSWGGMIAAGRADMALVPALVLIPSAVLFLTVFSLNTVGDGLRKVLASRG
jgi:peptide/nickel transport system permease protein